MDSWKRIKSVVWTWIDLRIFDDTANTLFWKRLSVDKALGKNFSPCDNSRDYKYRQTDELFRPSERFVFRRTNADDLPWRITTTTYACEVARDNRWPNFLKVYCVQLTSHSRRTKSKIILPPTFKPSTLIYFPCFFFLSSRARLTLIIRPSDELEIGHCVTQSQRFRYNFILKFTAKFSTHALSRLYGRSWQLVTCLHWTN